MFDGAEVVLGPDTSVELLGPVPPEQQFINQKMRPGSGVLSIRVIPDGPTRALQVITYHKSWHETPVLPSLVISHSAVIAEHTQAAFEVTVSSPVK